MPTYTAYNRPEPVYLQPAAGRNDLDHATDPRDPKRTRLDAPTRTFTWDPRQQPRTTASRAPNQGAVLAAFGHDLVASARGAAERSHVPAAEALASIQGVEPLLDEGAEWGSARGTGIASSVRTSTTLSSLTDDEEGDDDDDDEYVEDD